MSGDTLTVRCLCAKVQTMHNVETNHNPNIIFLRPKPCLHRLLLIRIEIFFVFNIDHV